MLDVFLLAKVLLVGGLTAVVFMLLSAWGNARLWQRSACWSWAVGAGVLAASGATDQWPHWPALEDRGRFLTLLVPLALLVDTLASTARSRRVAWIMRAGLAAIVTPILLHNSVYLADLDGRNSAEWSFLQATIVLCGLAALLMLWWAMLSGLQSQTSSHVVMWVLALDALAVAATVMLSGYYRAGLLGLGLAAALAGATLASHLARPQSTANGSLGMAVVGIFSVLLAGRFFGQLSTGQMAWLLLAPMLVWTVELPRLRSLSPGWRNAVRLSCLAVPLIVIVIVAQRKFIAASTARSTPSSPSAFRDLHEK
jgi:hypothetical protein